MTKVVLICMISFCLVSPGWSQDKGQLIDEVIGVVGNETLLHSEVEAQILSYGEQGLQVDDDIKTQIIEDLLFQKLLLHHARVDSLEVTEAAILGEVDRRLEYFVQVFGSIAAFEEYFGQSVAEWKAELRDPIEEQLLIQQMQGQIDDRVNATPSQVKEYYENTPADSLPLINSEIEYSVIEVKPKVRKSEKDLSRALLDSIRNEVISGNLSMFLAAFNYSEDPGSNSKGGCYDNVRRGQFVPEFEAAVYEAGEGGYSPIFESDFGFHFVKVKEIRGEVYSPCHILVKPKILDEDVVKAGARMDSIVDVLRKNEITFKKAAINYSTNEESSNQGGAVVNPATGGFKHDVSSIDPKVFFILDNLEKGEISEPSIVVDPVDGGQSYVIYKITERREAHRANLKLDYLMFQRQAENELRTEALAKWISKKIGVTYIKLADGIQSLKYKNQWLVAEG